MRKTGNILVIIGLIGIAIAVFLPLFSGPQSQLFRYIYSVAAVVLLAGRLMTPMQTKALRIKRLDRMQTWSAIFFCAAAVCMWLTPAPNDWLAFTLAGGLIQCYASLMLPRLQRKEANQNP